METVYHDGAAHFKYEYTELLSGPDDGNVIEVKKEWR